jgi:hypothetical protein
MRRLCFVVLLTIIVVPTACRRTERQASQQPSTTTGVIPQDLSKAKVNAVLPTPEPVFVTQTRLGSKLGADGNVAEEKTSFKRTEPIYLTMWLKESPAGLQTSVRWYDSKGEQVEYEFKPMNGAMVVTFKFDLKRPKPGDYRAVGYWGGNIATEYNFKITK